jgi:hypothetical protein
MIIPVVFAGLEVLLEGDEAKIVEGLTQEFEGGKWRAG